MAISPQGNIVVAGSRDNSDGEPQYLVAQYGRDGALMWAQQYASSRRKNNRLEALTLDPNGNILLGGSSDTVKFDPFGNRIWSAPFSAKSIAANSQLAYATTLTTNGYATVQIGNEMPAPTDLILDCDPGQDADDMSDLAIAHSLMTRGEINLLAVMGAHLGPPIQITIDVMNRYYGHPNMPVGIPTVGPVVVEAYGWFIQQRYGGTIGYRTEFPDATALYRSILASRPDHSVTIVFGGHLRNLLNVWNSGPDNVSGLYGPALLAKKVKDIVIVGGFFPNSWDGAEYNFFSDLEATLLLNRITDGISITFVGCEQGEPILIPTKGVSVMEEGNPVRYAHELFGAPSRPAWTSLGLLLAARGLSWNGNTYFTTTQGRVTIGTNGSNLFVENNTSNQRYAQKTQADTRYGEILDDLLLMPRPATPQAGLRDATGRDLWIRPFSGRASDVANFVRVNSAGEVFVAGVEAVVNHQDVATGRFALMKYGETGSLRWRKKTTNTVEALRTGTELRTMTATNGAIWLFGQYGDGAAVFKFSESGAQLWSHNFPVGTKASQMVVGPGGEVYIATSSSEQVTVTVISATGKLVAEAPFPHDPQVDVVIEAAVLKSSGEVYFAGGSTDRSTGKSAVLLLKCEPSLTQLSSITYPATYAGEARATAMAGQGEDVYLTGYMPTADGRSELFTLKYAPAFHMEKAPDGPLQLTYRVAPNQFLTLEATHDFSKWEEVVKVQANERGIARLMDTNTADWPHRFYRVKNN